VKVYLPFRTLEWIEETESLRIIDQTLLPEREEYLDLRSVEEVYGAIKVLRVRGAPAIGVAAAFGTYLAIKDEDSDAEALKKKLNEAADYLKSCRPTAVNLSYAVDTVLEEVETSAEDEPSALKRRVLATAERLRAEDEEKCRLLGLYGAELMEDNSTVLTNCNAGALATCGIGTALAAVYTAKAEGKRVRVVCCETRPLLQGARLSCWELQKAGVETTLICDNMAGSLMRSGAVDMVVVGADRIASNGDVANKIGTYPLAALARIHSIPFYVVAPSTSFDLSIDTGDDIPIEQRPEEEVRTVRGKVGIAPEGVSVYNPAFDVTPADLITAIVSEFGVIEPPFKTNIAEVLRNE